MGTVVARRAAQSSTLTNDATMLRSGDAGFDSGTMVVNSGTMVVNDGTMVYSSGTMLVNDEDDDGFGDGTMYVGGGGSMTGDTPAFMRLMGKATQGAGSVRFFFLV